ncbi:MAG: magnesium/cobalt transporter CorA [Candidatus Lokiarchaeia archaeon]
MPGLRFIRKSSKMVGLPPGTLVHIGEEKIGKIKITIMDYDEAQFQEMEAKKVEDCFPFKDTPTITWININGVHQTDTIEKIGKHYEIHPLTLENIMNTEQRPKMEDFENYIFIILKMLYYDEEENEIKSEQVSLIIGPKYVISFQENEGDVFNPVRERIRSGKGRIRKMGSDYLAYALIDSIVDNYFVILEKVGEKIEDIEEELVTTPSPKTLQVIHNLKRKLLFLHKSVWPLREVISGLERGESPLIKETTSIFLRNAYDHTIQVIDITETSREMLSDMVDTYLSSLSNKMNEIMKVLTIFATIFIPLTFLASIYGMNFTWMPELTWPEGYHMVLIAMLGVGILMLIYFRRKKWI